MEWGRASEVLKFHLESCYCSLPTIDHRPTPTNTSPHRLAQVMFALANALYSRIRKRPVPEDDDESLPSNAGKRTKPSSAAEAADPTNVVAVDEAVIAPVTTAADVVEASEVEEDEEEDEDEASLGVLATSLPTVAQMYTQNMLQATTNGEVFTHDAALNDKIIIQCVSSLSHPGRLARLKLTADGRAVEETLRNYELMLLSTRRTRRCWEEEEV